MNELLSAKRDDQRIHFWILSAIVRLAENFQTTITYIFAPVASLFQAVRSFVIGPGMGLLFVVRFLIEITLFILNLQLPKWILNGVALKDLSAAGKCREGTGDFGTTNCDNVC